MSENCNNGREGSIYFPIELEPFPFKSSSTGKIDDTTQLCIGTNESSKLNESDEVKENKPEDVEHANDGGNMICTLKYKTVILSNLNFADALKSY